MFHQAMNCLNKLSAVPMNLAWTKRLALPKMRPRRRKKRGCKMSLGSYGKCVFKHRFLLPSRRSSTPRFCFDLYSAFQRRPSHSSFVLCSAQSSSVVPRWIAHQSSLPWRPLIVIAQEFSRNFLSSYRIDLGHHGVSAI